MQQPGSKHYRRCFVHCSTFGTSKGLSCDLAVGHTACSMPKAANNNAAAHPSQAAQSTQQLLQKVARPAQLMGYATARDCSKCACRALAAVSYCCTCAEQLLQETMHASMRLLQAKKRMLCYAWLQHALCSTGSQQNQACRHAYHVGDCRITVAQLNKLLLSFGPWMTATGTEEASHAQQASVWLRQSATLSCRV